MTDLEARFQRALTIQQYGSPDFGAIAARAQTRAHNKRVGSGLASLAVLAVGAVGLLNTVNGSSSVVEAADGSLSVDLDVGDAADASSTTAASAPSQPIIAALSAASELCFGYDNTSGAGTLAVSLEEDGNVSVDESRVRGSTDDPGFVFRFRGEGQADGLRVRAQGSYESEGQQQSLEELRMFGFSEDLATVAGPEFVYTGTDCGDPGTAGQAAPGQVLSDGYGGSLVIDAEAGLLHQRSDGSLVPIELPSIDAEVVQRWPTDLASVEGTFYLFIDQLVNLAPAPGEDVHLEVSILALNLETDELIEVERRVITDTDGPDWIYNGHITSNGEDILVMREFWQSTCLYAEALSLSGSRTNSPETAGLERPPWMDDITDDVRSKLSTAAGTAELGCITLNEIDDGGVATLGRQADPTTFEDFTAGFLLLYG